METINDYMPLSNDWNDERLQTLKQVYPDWFTSEGSLNIDEVKKAVNPESVNETERYEFRWFGKSQAKRNAFTPSNATLVYDENRSVNPDSSENLIIEGENLEVLKLLSGSYREKVKCIYIDPPYNTGKDFVYSDNFTQDKKGYWEDAEILEKGVKIDTNTETDGRYHSNWLNMMYSRLLIARQLLKEDGVVFISIDDNEVHHLRKLCDEVFGEENFTGEFVWKRRASSALSENNVSNDHEYVICYSKNNFEGFKGVEKDFKSYSNPDNDYRGPWVLGDLTVGMTAAMRPNQAYDLVDPVTNNIFPFNPNRVWSFIPTSMQKMIDENRVYFPKDATKRPMQKRFQNELKSELNPFSTLMMDKVGLNTEATRIMQNIMGGNYFDYSKPTSLLKAIIPQVAKNDSDIILDFFGGSGTLGQAVMELNEEDGVNRKFIIVQIPETIDIKSEAYKAGYKKISDITIERNKRVVTKIIKEKESQQPDLFAEDKKEDALKGLGFKVFKLQKSNFPRVDFAPNPEFNETENLELLKKYITDKESQLVNAFNKKELLTEILLKNNFTLNYTTIPQEQFTKNEILFATDGEKETLICLDVSIAPETVSHFKAHTDTKFICLERALDTTIKYNLKHYLGDKFNAF